MRYNGIIQRKLALLDTYIQKLGASMAGVAEEQFVQDWEKLRMSERSLQVCVEVMIDVAERIIALEGAGPVATAADAMKALVQLKIIESTSPYEDMIKFRNFIVHQYEEIEPRLLYRLLTTRLDDFRKFRDEIDRLG